MQIKWTLVGLGLDALDLVEFVVGPGNVIAFVGSTIGTVIWIRVLGSKGFVSILEMIPYLDLLPLNTALGIYADMKKVKVK
jgi:hypothetical protein